MAKDKLSEIRKTLESSEWKDSLLRPDASIQDVINNLNQVGLKICLIVTESGTLVGTISDGDIRRGLLRGLTLKNLARDIVHHNPLVVPQGMRSDAVKQLMLANKI
jgi:CBS domain-containing protein